MHITVFDPIGAHVTGISLTSITTRDVDQLTRLLADHGVVVLPGQAIDDDAFLEFLARFGTLTFTAGETPVEGFPDLNVISNVGRMTPPRSVFHVDTSYVRQPPAYTALRAVSIPRRGGQTVFSNQYRAFDTLPGFLRNHLAGRSARHAVRADGVVTEAEHPIFRTHPISGRTSLYLSTPERCHGISGMDDDESERTIAHLYAHSTEPGNTFRHTWADGDVVIWDNRVVMHRADHDGVEGDRVMHRGMVTR